MDMFPAPDFSPADGGFEPDGGWFCPICHSLNRPRVSRCYGCLRPLLAAPKSASGGAKTLRCVGLLAALALSSIVVLGFSSRLAQDPASAASGPQFALVDATRYAAPTASAASAEPTMMAILTATPTSRTMLPAAAPTTAPTPTAAPTTAPVSRATPRAVSKPVPVSAGPPDIPVSIPGVTVKYYDISGASEEALISAMLANGPGACGISDAAACFEHAFSWTYGGTVSPSTGACTVNTVNFNAAYTIILPRWTGPAVVPPALVTWWRAVVAHFVWHESQHLAIARSYVPKYQAAIAAGPCDQASQNKLTAAISANLEAAQKAFDAQDRQDWTWPPYGG